MNYPLISEYIEAIRSAEDNFDKLSNLRPVLDGNGNPIMSSGNFAVVFKMKDIVTDRLFAVKCFIKNQEGRSERYAKIADELQYVSSPYILHVRYLEREFFVDSANCDEEEFPVLVMDWVDGQPLDAYLRQHLDDTYGLQMLAYSFCRMGAWLLSQPFAHGDLKPDNILVRDDGTLVLVDYDGMFVPSMEGETAMETGSPDFRHPLRTEQSFNEHIDDFSIATIALSLKAISLKPELYNEFSSADRLLFSQMDYRDLSQSKTFKNILNLVNDNEFSNLLAAFILSHANNSLNKLSYRIFLLNKPIYCKKEEKRAHKYTNKNKLGDNSMGALKWTIIDVRKFTQEELDLVDKAMVVDSKYGNSCCFFMKNGTKLYLPMSHDAKSGVGDFIVLSEAEIVTLMKEGESNIQRIRG